MLIGKLIVSFLTASCFCSLFLVTGCVPQSTGGAASLRANATADKVMYQPVEYTNASIKGPTLVVLPGQIKCNNATFIQRISTNAIADFAELELSNANFKVLERSDLGPMLDEINLAVGMGDPEALKKFKRGKFKSTKWFVKLDVLKAENVSSASSGFDGRSAGSILGSLVPGLGGAISSTALSSVKQGDAAGVWLVGMRYKLIDASTSEQVTTGYFEQKMETGQQSQSFMGISGAAEQKITLDSIVQRLVQEVVADIDKKKI